MTRELSDLIQTDPSVRIVYNGWLIRHEFSSYEACLETLVVVMHKRLIAAQQALLEYLQNAPAAVVADTKKQPAGPSPAGG